MTNSIMVIKPYWYSGTWVFDDESRGMDKEAFVSGAPEIINAMVKDIPKARKGFRMLFSQQPFPGYQKELVWVREEWGGNWYRAEDMKAEGWLCPSLFQYFDKAPSKIYTKAERIKV